MVEADHKKVILLDLSKKIQCVKGVTDHPLKRQKTDFYQTSPSQILLKKLTMNLIFMLNIINNKTHSSKQFRNGGCSLF